MKKKIYEKVEDIPDETEAPETEGLKDTDTLPSEAKTAPISNGPEGKEEEKAPPVSPKKKKEPGQIIGLMGVIYQEGPPGSTHG
jgi:hypothetical protein